MKHKHNRWIMGSAVGIASIIAAIDHTRHKIPEADTGNYLVIQEDDDSSPCGPDASPCGPEASPCGPDESPCGV